MGNSLGCSASGERLVSAARDGDLVEARMLLEFNPCLAKYSTFGGLNSPLHFAAAKGHNEIVMLLLENGAEVNSRNYCGQTALMQACRHGHWEVVQTLLLFRSNVTRADYLSGRTALHFAAADGHVRCIRLLAADFVPSAPYDVTALSKDGGDNAGSKDSSPDSSSGRKHDQIVLSRFINKPADGGITALHMAALNGYFDCVQLLLDLGANVSSVTFHYSSTMNLIGAGSTPLHYAACGGNLKCCQILLARGASRLTLNCNGWLPLDIARIWGRHWLEPLLSPDSVSTIPTFTPSNYLSLPLMSILNIARECGLQSSTASSDDGDLCSVCLERGCSVAAEGCGHELCVKCALYLCSTSNIPSEILGPPGSIPCPLCRHGIVSFIKLARSPAKGLKPNLALSLCNPCIVCPRVEQPETGCRSEIRKNRVAAVSSELVCPLTCSPFPSVAIPSCNCDDDPCSSHEPQGETQAQSPRRSQSAPNELDKMEEQRVDRTSCSGMFWNRRSCHREHQCNSEINA
ncbi:probable E3 ubiquitin-protein ligase XBOS33 [Phoenix dactylifera]|uniref:RING-type E3 ubiquitin transferase n=1 Tax=Phoenix dactylifera TaxID=42345 RepID=A0A8B7CI23_PHODC|nr:probable E3 ubiquitin-protein ligase XBOS33 [Phoenix dactylifera]